MLLIGNRLTRSNVDSTRQNSVNIPVRSWIIEARIADEEFAKKKRTTNFNETIQQNLKQMNNTKKQIPDICQKLTDEKKMVEIVENKLKLFKAVKI